MKPRADVLTQNPPLADERSLREGCMHSVSFATAPRNLSYPDLCSHASPPDLPPNTGQASNASTEDDNGGDEETDPKNHQPLLSSPASATTLPVPTIPAVAPFAPTLPARARPGTNAPGDVWNDSVPVLGSQKKKLIYFRAPFQWGQWTEEQWTKRFIFVTKQLEDLVDKHLGLVDQDSLPTYRPRMVGTCPTDARPSIVVMCRETEFKSIRNTFQNRAAEPLRVGKPPFVDRLRASLGQPPEGGERAIPRLPLVYYRTPTAVTRNGLDETLLANLGDGGLVCGGIIRYGGRSATLGVAIDVGGRTGILTVDHLFPSKATHPPPTAMGNESSPSNESKSPVLAELEWSDSDRLWEDDDEYDDLDTDELAEAMDLDDKTAAESFELRQAFDTHSTRPEPEPERWDTLASSSSAQLTSTPYLDWALTRPASTASNFPNFRVNTVLPGGPGTEPVVLESFHHSPMAHLAPVYIVSGIRGLVHGEILFAPSLLPSFPGRDYCEVWTVIPRASNGKGSRNTHPSPRGSQTKRALTDGIVSGESGSVVVDTATNRVYGHIVGSDPFGHAYVAPLADVLAQVVACFPGVAAAELAVPHVHEKGRNHPERLDAWYEALYTPDLRLLGMFNRSMEPVDMSHHPLRVWEREPDTLLEVPSDITHDVQHPTSATHPLTETNLALWKKTQESSLADKPSQPGRYVFSETHPDSSWSVAAIPPSTRNGASSVIGEDTPQHREDLDMAIEGPRVDPDETIRDIDVAFCRPLGFMFSRPRISSHTRGLSASTTHSVSEPLNTLATTDADGSGIPYQQCSHPDTNCARCISLSYFDDAPQFSSGSESSPPQYAKTIHEADLWDGSTATDQNMEEEDAWALEPASFSDMEVARRLLEKSKYQYGEASYQDEP